MGLELKGPQICLLLFFCGWVALSEGTDDPPGPEVRIDKKTIECSAKKSMTESNILEELAEAATKNQGGAKAIKGIKGLKVQDIQPPNITMTCIPDKGIEMRVGTQITICGKSFIGGSMQITVKSEMKTVSCMVKDAAKNIAFKVIECGVKLISCKTNLPSSMLPKIVNKFLNSTLVKVLPGMMCPAADKVVGHMEDKMKPIFAPYTIGDRGTIQYTLAKSPIITSDAIIIPFNVQVQDKHGNKIPIPMDPPASKHVPPKQPDKTQVTMPVNLLNGLLKLYEDIFIYDSKTSDLTTDRLVEVMPGLAGKVPPSKKVKVEMTPAETPVCLLKEAESKLEIHYTVVFKTVPGNEPVCSMNMVLLMDMDVKLKEEALEVFVIAGSGRVTDITVTSPSVDDVNNEGLKHLLEELVERGCIPRINSGLAKDKMKLPNLMGADYSDHKIEKSEDTVSLHVDHSKNCAAQMPDLKKFQNIALNS